MEEQHNQESGLTWTWNTWNFLEYSRQLLDELEQFRLY